MYKAIKKLLPNLKENYNIIYLHVQGKFGNFFNENINSTIKEIGWKSSIFLYFKLFHSAYNLKKFYHFEMEQNFLLILKKQKKLYSLWKTVFPPLRNSPYSIKKYDSSRKEVEPGR